MRRTMIMVGVLLVSVTLIPTLAKVRTAHAANDTAPPSAPTGLRVTRTSASSVSLGWTAATDDVGVVSYAVYKGTSLAARVSGTTATVSGLPAATECTFTVRALDGAGNVSGASKPVTTMTFRRIGYLPQWAGRQGYLVKNLVTSGAAARLSTVIYAFGDVTADGKCALDPNFASDDYQRSYTATEAVDGVADTAEQPLAGNFNQLKKLKAKFPALRVVISLGGAGVSSRYFSDAALTAASRKSFVASCINMFLKGNLPVAGGRGGTGSGAGVFDGIDIDWEYPNCGCADVISRPEDKQNLTLLLAEFRAQLNDLGAATGRSYTTSAAISSAPSRLDAGYEVNHIFTYLNWANVMTYNMHGPWQLTTNHQAPIWSPDPSQRSIDQSIKYLVKGGASARKLALGVPFFGRGWTGVTNANHGLFQPATGPAAGDSLPYRERSTLTGYTTYRDAAAGEAWLFNGSTFYNLDDPQVIKAKMAYVANNRLAGAMVWALNQDTDNGELIGALDALNTGW